jgi:hypothetical protein
MHQAVPSAKRAPPGAPITAGPTRSASRTEIAAQTAANRRSRREPKAGFEDRVVPDLGQVENTAEQEGGEAGEEQERRRTGQRERRRAEQREPARPG